ncbi:MAG: cobamide remodeling phosphodiesterase CbiR, partial [Thermodesulfobacteriota bacterium]|nr:cobamide remodeling phosphodiesterase CbiR [Thermodesulfobacteriota bacterium]
SCAEKIKTAPWTLAAPSYVWPDTVAANCRLLDGLFPEVGILFFETEKSLEYTDKDLPPWLSDLDLRYHVHLPLDLPWDRGFDAAFSKIEKLMAKVEFLSPRAFVLHPPPERSLLTKTASRWRKLGLDPEILLLENTRECGHLEIMDSVLDLGLGVCLDLGHLLAYEQLSPEGEAFWDRVGMLHLSAPKGIGQSGHLCLSSLSGPGRDLLRSMLARTGRDAVITLELFNEPDLLSSVDVLWSWFKEWGFAR